MQTGLNRRTFLTTAVGFAAACQVPIGWAKTGADATLRLESLSNGVFLSQGAGTNVVVVSGADGALMIDGGTPAQSRALLRLVAAQVGPVRTLVNTHWHPDHTGCNESLGKAGATLVAHENTRLWMQRPIHVAWQQQDYPAMPVKALPTKTFYTQETVAAGDYTLRLGTLGQAHTDGDIYAHLADANVLVVGDAVSVGSYPVVDWSTGGWNRGLFEATNTLLKLCDDQTRIVPGTGPVVGKAHLQKQHDMLDVLTERVWQLMRKGMSDLDIVAARPTAEYDAEWGDPRQFLLNSYASIWNHVREMKGHSLMRSIAWLIGSVLMVAAGVVAAAEPSAGTPAGEGAQHFAMLEKYCSDCHNATDWAGGVAFETMQPDSIPADAKVWEEAVRKLRGGLMPPPGKPHPDAATSKQFVSWMEARLDEHAADNPDPGYIALHRINRTEYARAVESILGVEVDPATILPQETKSDGFDNVANVLRVSPTFLDQYISAARTVSVKAVGDPNARAISTTYRASGGRNASYREGMPLGTRGGMEVEHWFPADGVYEISLRVSIGGGYGFGFGEQTVILKVDGQRVKTVKTGGEEDARNIDQRQAAAAAEIAARFQKIRVPIKAGPHRITVTFTQESYAEDEARLFPFTPGGSNDSYANVGAIDIKGPYDISGVSDTPSRQKIFICRPAAQADEPDCARRILTRITREAYRRPVTDADLEAPMAFFAEGRKQGSFDSGIQTAIMAVLSNPKFLYRFETAPAHLPVGTVYALDDLAIASRLAFFLWSEGPDEELLSLAAAGRLKDAAVLDQQVQRLLSDPRSSTLVSNFAYQWLNLAALKDVDADPALFPWFDEDLRRSYLREVELFVDSVLRNDRSVVDLLTADYSFLNERLALQYRVPNVRGSQFRRVTLADSTRYGLLGKGAILMLTSYGNRTAPVLRGAYVLERITGTPPKAPPPGVEALPEKGPDGKAMTVRERLELHRTSASCNACHGLMDPLGFALENFDAVGTWRKVDREALAPVDAGATMPDGHVLKGPDDLRNMLASNPDQFVQALTEKLMTYALGRTVEYHDMPRIRAIVRDAGSHGYRFASLVSGIVHSDQFLKGKVVAPTAPIGPATQLTQVK